MYRHLLIFILSQLLFVSYAKSETLDDCILNGLEGVTSDYIAEQIIKSCNNKFKNTKSTQQEDISEHSYLTVGRNKKWTLKVPAGKYELTAKSSMMAANVGFYWEIYESFENGKLKNAVWVRYTGSKGQWGWKPSQLCARNNFHYMNRKSNNDGGKQECNFVNHWRVVGSSDVKKPNAPWNKVMEKAREYHRKNNIPLPKTLIAASSHFANKNLIEVRVLFNPMYSGFPDTVNSEWASNDWHQDVIIGDEKRQKYINQIISYAKEMHSDLKSQFTN